MFIHADVYLRRTNLPPIRLALDAELGQGRIHRLAGPPCGQEELVRILAGRLRPDRGLISAGGLIWFKGDATGRIEAGDRPVGAVFPEDEPPLDATPRLLLSRALAHWPTHARAPRLSEFLARTGLAPFERRQGLELSGDQRWLLALACALAPRPALLVLEAPGPGLPSGFEPGLRAWIRKEGVPVLLHEPRGISRDLPGNLEFRLDVLTEGAGAPRPDRVA